MREVAIHLAWLVTHFCRSFVDKSSERFVVELSQEVKILQAELHRAHRILEGYSTSFQREETAYWTLQRGNLVFVLLIAILTFLLWWSWTSKHRGPIPTPKIGDTGGSSDSDSGSELDQPSIEGITFGGATTQLSKPSGPIRPSSFGKGRK